MNAREAESFLGSAVEHGGGGTWADMGAGDGVFTRALASILGPSARIYAVDRDAGAVASLVRLSTSLPGVIPVQADFTDPNGVLPDDIRLDGMLIANALHFVRDADVVLARLAASVRRDGTVVVIEYERRGPSRWVPYPISEHRLGELAVAAGLAEPVVTARRPSDYGGEIYVARMNSR